MRTTTNYNEEGVKMLNYNIKFPETDLPAFETFFKKYNVEVAPIDEEDDFYYELSAEELQKIEKAREQSRLSKIFIIPLIIGKNIMVLLNTLLK